MKGTNISIRRWDDNLLSEFVLQKKLFVSCGVVFDERKRTEKRKSPIYFVDREFIPNLGIFLMKKHDIP